MANINDKQIENRNFLSSVGFKFTLNRISKVSFFTNTANIPGMNLGIANQPTYLKDLDLPGDKLAFDDFRLNFLVDENFENYMQVQNWMRGLGYPESLHEIYDLQNEPREINDNSKMMNIYSDGTLEVLNSNFLPRFKVKFQGLFPTYLSGLTFDATDQSIKYFTAEAVFRYTNYIITDMNDRRL
jgi:hypothetical protein